MAEQAGPVIFVVSDGSGETCDHLVQAALAQFEGRDVEIVRRGDVLSRELVDEVLAEADARRAAVFYTLVGTETRRAMANRAAELLVPTVDVLGPAFTALHDVFQQAPSARPGLFHAVEREDVARHLAIDYTLKHDDGQRPAELKDADVVLVGISRVSKSTTCFYLAYNGIKAANVPLVKGQPPLPGLLAVRETRVRHLGRIGTAGYVDKREVAAELRDAHAVMERHGWRNFDASYMAVEEIAREVARLRGLTFGGRG